MKLLRELNEAIKQRNFVAKHAHLAGKAGAHDMKKGHKKAKRAKQKQALHKELKNY